MAESSVTRGVTSLATSIAAMGYMLRMDADEAWERLLLGCGAQQIAELTVACELGLKPCAPQEEGDTGLTFGENEYVGEYIRGAANIGDGAYLRYAIQHLGPRVHFALGNCCSKPRPWQVRLFEAKLERVDWFVVLDKATLASGKVAWWKLSSGTVREWWRDGRLRQGDASRGRAKWLMLMEDECGNAGGVA